VSFQAGIFYFGDREIGEFEARAIRAWVRSDDCESPTSSCDAGVFLAHAALHFNRRTPEEAQPFLGQTCAVTFDGRLDNRKDLLLRLRSALSADTSDAALAAAGL